MSDSANSSYRLGVYLHLSQASLRRRRPLVRDRMLVLAGVEAANLCLKRLENHCRIEILNNNPRHLIGKWETVGEALLDDEFLAFLKNLRRKYPVERAERLLDSLGIEIGNERDAYFTDNEYAAAILGLEVNALTDVDSRDDDSQDDP